MVTLTIDGARHSGTYQVTCQCGASWTGQGETLNAYSWSPAAPIAECVAHMKLDHPQGMTDLVFTERFEAWLLDYWRRMKVVAPNSRPPSRQERSVAR